MQHERLEGPYFFHRKREQVDAAFFESYRCYDSRQERVFSARARRFGKPMPIFAPGDDSSPVAEVRNRKGYLVNGRTDILDLRSGSLLGSYTRFSGVYDAGDEKVGAWRDARSWREEFKENLIDAVGNALLGAGDAPAGANPSDTHVLSRGKSVLAVLQREKMPFFPDPPKRSEPGKVARLASRIIPGELGRSLGEISPPYGWTLAIHEESGSGSWLPLLLYCAVVRIEFLRWSRSA